jgi:hypothetical protein
MDRAELEQSTAIMNVLGIGSDTALANVDDTLRELAKLREERKTKQAEATEMLELQYEQMVAEVHTP